MARLTILKPGVSTLDVRVQQPPKVGEDFYNTTAWRALVVAIIAERGRKCERCARQGVRLYGDHIQEIKDGGAKLDRANVQLLCAPCHTKKTADARADRMRR